MAKQAICDQCGAAQPLQQVYHEIPATWFTLRQSFTDEQHLCSIECLRAAVEKRAAAAAPVSEPPAAPFQPGQPIEATHPRALEDLDRQPATEADGHTVSER